MFPFCSNIHLISFTVFVQVALKRYNIEAHYDSLNKLHYINHNGLRLYFPINSKPNDICLAYKNYIERENLLGGGFSKKAPHQYQSDSIFIDKGDILLDIGCAEALLSLDTINKTKSTYLFESEKHLEKPLKCTFNPFKTKAFIINKKVSNNDSNKETTLNSLFENYQNNSFFVKMDIEGAEEFVLRSNEKFFKSHNKIKIACCTYHKQEHAENIENILNDWGYKTSFSDGYMLDFPFNDFAAPYFRKGVIRGVKQ